MKETTTLITTLETLAKQVPITHMPYWITPNTLLTLAGARAYCDGVFWGSETQVKIWQQEIDADLKVLKTILDVQTADSGVTVHDTDSAYASYDLLLQPGLDQVLATTELFHVKAADLATDSFISLKKSCIAKLRSAQGDTFTNEELEHIWFGILLGYPDKAITGMTLLTREHAQLSDDTFAEPGIDADVRGADYYDCPQPVYDYPRHLVSDVAIQAHEQHWSTILKDFYTSDFHQKLAANAEFQTKIAELNLR